MAIGLNAVSFQQHLRFIKKPVNNLLFFLNIIEISYRLFTHSSTPTQDELDTRS